MSTMGGIAWDLHSSILLIEGALRETHKTDRRVRAALTDLRKVAKGEGPDHPLREAIAQLEEVEKRDSMIRQACFRACQALTIYLVTVAPHVPGGQRVQAVQRLKDIHDLAGNVDKIIQSPAELHHREQPDAGAHSTATTAIPKNFEANPGDLHHVSGIDPVAITVVTVELIIMFFTRKRSS